MKHLYEWNSNKDTKDIDPHNEEDWDEYELSSGDRLIFFACNNKENHLEAGYGKAKLQNDRLSLFTDIIIDEKEDSGYEYPNELDLNNDVKNGLETDKNVYAGIFQLSHDKHIIAIIPDSKVGKSFTTLQSIVRNYLNNNINNKRNELKKIEDELHKNEQTTLQLKTSLKSEEEYPNPKEIVLDDDQYIVLKSKPTGNKNIQIDVVITKLSPKKDGEGHNLMGRNGEKVLYLANSYDKLKERGYLILKSKRHEDEKTFVTRNLDLYTELLSKMINQVNDSLKSKIEENRKKYLESLDTIDALNIELKKCRNNYLSLNIYGMIKRLRSFEGEEMSSVEK